jgi:hypothetical protein
MAVDVDLMVSVQGSQKGRNCSQTADVAERTGRIVADLRVRVVTEDRKERLDGGLGLRDAEGFARGQPNNFLGVRQQGDDQFNSTCSIHSAEGFNGSAPGLKIGSPEFSL